MSYYIGVDGGGTKTAYALFDEKKNIIAMVKGPGSNHENMEGSFDEAADIIWDGIKSLIKEAGISLHDVEYTLMGLAGIDHQFQHDEMVKRLLDYGLENFEIYNDGFIVIKAGSTGSAAIGYNCGTGTCCNAIDNDGKMLQLAGLGEFSGDEGNGHWIAMRTFRAIYDDVYLGLRKTALTKMCYDEYSLKCKEDFLALVSRFEDDDADKFIMRLIDFFFDAARLGDSVVLDIIDEMATRGASLIAAHLNTLNFTDDVVEVVLSGSIHTKLPSDIYINALMNKAVSLTGRRLKFIKLSQPPVTGCINWILQQKAKKGD
ncbi:MAG: BadF/BadG/BcrA/BcrD ATPase family protein [Clostridia bacterium]|nr:BadF/BadG/BcrA/BcrD ATPase family protein [Clostridia bacterium]